jgi:hypothetical protein
MGQTQIEEKLDQEFRRDTASESQVVYILVEIGKLLEHDKAKSQFRAINFYRNWVVHTKLEQSDLADELVRAFDEYVASNNQTASDRLKELVSPQMLRDELAAFLAVHHLTFPCCADGGLWKRFVKYLAGVIAQSPLRCSLPRDKNNPPKPTRHVKSVTVSRSRDQDGRAMLTWEADCHTAPPAGVDTTITVVLLPDIDQIALP